MTTPHTQLDWFAGDDWQINATLLDENDNPFNLGGGAQIKWALMLGNQRVLDEDDVSVAIIDAAAGKCAIHVPAAKTSPLITGRYIDTIRIVTGGITSTLAVGWIQVTGDPWRLEEPVAAANKTAPRIRLAATR